MDQARDDVVPADDDVVEESAESRADGLRRRRRTRPLVRTVPTIVNRTTRRLAAQAAKGRPVTPAVAQRVFQNETRDYYDLDRLWADAPAINWEPVGQSAQSR